MMKKIPNPLFVSSAPNRELGRLDLVGHKKQEAVRKVDRRWKIGDRETENRELRTEESGFPSSISQTPSAAQREAAPVRHERPKRFKYGAEGKK